MILYKPKSSNDVAHDVAMKFSNKAENRDKIKSLSLCHPFTRLKNLFNVKHTFYQPYNIFDKDIFKQALGHQHITKYRLTLFQLFT